MSVKWLLTCVAFLLQYAHCSSLLSFLFFSFNDTATTEIYTLSLHDALPIFRFCQKVSPASNCTASDSAGTVALRKRRDRKSTRLNSSHTVISYAVFCLKKKNTQ